MGDSRSIAVIGMGCELPGASGPAELWRLLLDGRDVVGDARVETGMRQAGHVDPARWTTGFDAASFGIDPCDADRVDPRQRLLLAVTRAAFADAGIDEHTLAGTRTAVFAGQSASDHWDRRFLRDDLDLRDFAGSHQRGLTAGRLSYVFDLRGPSVTVDAAQASSLVAVHLAVRALRSGDADLAVAAGVNLLLGKDPGTLLDRAGVLSASGLPVRRPFPPATCGHPKWAVRTGPLRQVQDEPGRPRGPWPVNRQGVAGPHLPPDLDVRCDLRLQPCGLVSREGFGRVIWAANASWAGHHEPHVGSSLG